MRRIVWSVVAMFLSLALLNCAPVFAQSTPGSAPAVEAPTGPLAEIPEKFHSFGKMVDLEVYKYDFVVKNVGTAPLEIKKVIKICGTEVGRFDHTIAPGGQTKIPVYLSAGACGPMETKKSILVLTNDKNNYFVLSVSGSSK